MQVVGTKQNANLQIQTSVVEYLVPDVTHETSSFYSMMDQLLLSPLSSWSITLTHSDIAPVKLTGD